VDSAARELEPWRRDPSTPLIVEARARPRPSCHRPLAAPARRLRRPGASRPRAVPRAHAAGLARRADLPAGLGDGRRRGRGARAHGGRGRAGRWGQPQRCAPGPASGSPRTRVARRRRRPAARHELCGRSSAGAARQGARCWSAGRSHTRPRRPASRGRRRAGRPCRGWSRRASTSGWSSRCARCTRTCACCPPTACCARARCAPRRPLRRRPRPPAAPPRLPCWPALSARAGAAQRERSGVVMQYRLLRAPPAAPARGRLLHFAFAPVDTQFGRLRMAVDYQARAPLRPPAASKPARGRRRGCERGARAQASAAVTVLEATTAPPPLPQIIADYVGRAPGGALGVRLASPLSASMHLPRPPGAPPDPAASPPAPAGARPRGRQPAAGADVAGLPSSALGSAYHGWACRQVTQTGPGRLHRAAGRGRWLRRLCMVAVHRACVAPAPRRCGRAPDVCSLPADLARSQVQRGPRADGGCTRRRRQRAARAARAAGVHAHHAARVLVHAQPARGGRGRLAAGGRRRGGARGGRRPAPGVAGLCVRGGGGRRGAAGAGARAVRGRGARGRRRRRAGAARRPARPGPSARPHARPCTAWLVAALR